MKDRSMTPATASDLSRRKLLAIGIGAVGAIAMRTTAAQQSDAYTFAVIGTDYRTPQDPELSDVLMVSRVNVEAGTVRTLSIPRDLYVEIPGHGYEKINAAFSIAVKSDPDQNWEVGAASTVATIEHNFGLQIDGVAQTNMQVFPQLVDAVGGVVVDNPYFLTDESFGDYPAGEITLTGEEAIRFCRSRNMDGDGGRVMRQHLVLGGMLAKLQSPAMLTRVPQLIDTLSGEVVNTNISTAIQARLIAMLPTLSGDNLAFTNIEDQLSPGYTSGGAWIYQGDWSTLPGYVQSWLAGP